jgi:hypothetical protein
MSNATEDMLNYLRHLPSYPFDATMDAAFVQELVDDFPEIDVLEETKAFRWYYDNEPASKMRQVRLGLRRWILRAQSRVWQQS